MELKCTNCGDNIDARLANIDTDLIQCPTCSTIHKLSELVFIADLEKEKRGAKKSYYSQPYHRERPKFEERAVITNFHDLPAIPLGSKINVLPTSGSLEIIAPPKGFGGADLFLLGFATFWLGFVAVWTFFAAMGFPIMALFSIPFWLVGFAMAGALVKKWSETQTIHIDDYGIHIRKKSLFFSSTKDIAYHEISEVDYKPATFKNAFSSVGMNTTTTSGNREVLLPTIQVGVKKITFLENALEAEKEWAMEVFNQVRVGR